MAKRKYTIIDDNGESMGFVVVETSPTFESVSSAAALPASGPIADSVLFVTVLGGITFTLWGAGMPGLWAALTSVGITSTLAAIKARYGQFIPDISENEGVLVKGEFTSTEGTIYLDEIQDDKIIMSALVKICKAVQSNDFVWMGRGLIKLKTNVGRTQYERIRTEFYRLNYFKDGEGGKILMTSRGRLFVRKVAALPQY